MALTEWRWAPFPRASWRCAVSGRSYNARIFDKFQQKLPSSVARRSTAAPIRLQCPVPLAVGQCVKQHRFLTGHTNK
jgi:hypothetical protein